MTRGSTASAAGLLLAATSALACPPTPADGALIADGALQAAWAVVDDRPIRVGEPFALRVRVCPDEAELVRVDAVMPAHRHGMNYRPSVTSIGNGRWRVDGLIWHMGGRWELRLDLRHGDRFQTLRQAVDLP